MTRRILSFLMALVMVVSLLPVNALAAQEVWTDGLCQHHQAHTEACGHGEDTPCGYECPECLALVTEDTTAATTVETTVETTEAATEETTEATEETLPPVKSRARQSRAATSGVVRPITQSSHYYLSRADLNQHGYIKDIFLVSDSNEQDAISRLTALLSAGSNSAYAYLKQDLNDGAGGEFVYLGWTTTTNVSEAITGLRLWNGGEDALETRAASIQEDGVTWTQVSDVDLNEEAGGDFIYLYATRDLAFGPPLMGISATLDDPPDLDRQVLSFSGCEDGSTPLDVNEGARGDFIYLSMDTCVEPIDVPTLTRLYDWASRIISGGSKYVFVLDLKKAASQAQPSYTFYSNSGNSQQIGGKTYWFGENSDHCKAIVDECISSLQTGLSEARGRVFLNAEYNDGYMYDDADQLIYKDEAIGTVNEDGTVNIDTGAYEAEPFVATASAVVLRRAFAGWSTDRNVLTGQASGTLTVQPFTTLYAIYTETRADIGKNHKCNAIGTFENVDIDWDYALEDGDAFLQDYCCEGTGYYEAGDTVTLTAATRNPEYKHFSHWELVYGEITLTNGTTLRMRDTITTPTISFTMPSFMVQLEMVSEWHDYQYDCDTTCSVCGATREAEHTYSLQSDAQHHWKACECGETSGPKEAHTGSDDGDCTTAVNCTVCGHEMTAANASHTGQDDGDCTTAVFCTVCGTMIREASSHRIENGSCTVCGKHFHDDGAEFLPWSDPTSLPAQGSYYLTADVTLNGTWVPQGGEYKLCLSGHSITQAAAQHTIRVNSGVTLDVYDCVGSGAITHSDGVTGGRGVYVNDGSFGFHGGSITKNILSNLGPGVYVAGGGSFTMTGGSITGNEGTQGGGVYVTGQGSFTMTGGIITGNEATFRGGGVYAGSDITLTGSARIIGNTAPAGPDLGLIQSSAQHAIARVKDLSADARIGVAVIKSAAAVAGTFTDAGGAGYMANFLNSHPDSYHMAENADGSLALEAHSWEGGQYAADETQHWLECTGCGLPAEKADHTWSDAWYSDGQDHWRQCTVCEAWKDVTAHTVQDDGDCTTAVLCPDCGYILTPATDAHTVENNTCTRCGRHVHGDGASYIPWNDSASLPGTAGSYCLTADVTLSGTWTPAGDVRLCLNGHSITQTVQGDVITVPAGVTLDLRNCADTGVITHKSGVTGRGITVNGALNTHNVTISGNNIMVAYSSAEAHQGGGVFVASTGSFTMEGGAVSGNSATNGGGVYVVRNGTLTITGSAITENNAHTNGGGVYTAVNSVSTITDSTITDNAVVTYGGGIYSTGSLTLERCTVTNNEADFGAGIDIVNGSVVIRDSSITGNRSEVYGGGVDVNAGTLSLHNVTITGNQSKTYGGGVYLNNHNLTASGSTTITGNTATDFGPNLLVGVSHTTNTSTFKDLTTEAKIGITTVGYDSSWKFGLMPGTFAHSGASYGANFEADHPDTYHIEADGSALALAAHTWTWGADGDRHWQACACGQTRNEGPHSYVQGRCQCGAETAAGYPIIPGLTDYMKNKTGFASANLSYASFFYKDLAMFENTQVDHINVFVSSVKALDDQQYMTVFVIDSATAQIRSEHRFYARVEDLTSTTPQKVISLYSRDQVEVGEGQTLMFAKAGDPIIWGYITSDSAADASFKGFWDRSGFSGGSSSLLCIDVYTTAAPVFTPRVYRWEPRNSQLQSMDYSLTTANAPAKTQGSIADTSFSRTRFTLARPVSLRHDQPWSIEWRGSGSWTDSTDGGLLFSAADTSSAAGNRYLYRRHNSDFIALGYVEGSSYHNYGVSLAGIDAAADHTWRLVNRLEDEGNMVWLYVDGEPVGPLTDYHLGGGSKSGTSDWLRGQDFRFQYIGTNPHTVGGCHISYILVNEGIPHEVHVEVPTPGVDATDTQPGLTEGSHCSACGHVIREQQVIPALMEGRLQALLSGKKLSIFGDSISTFAGYSNSTAVNDTLGGNAVYYPNGTITNVNDTWWKQAADRYGMELLVNNSWSGSSVTNKRAYGANSYGWNTRPGNLHDNTLADNPNGEAIDPDIIAIYMGTNDLMDNVTCNTTLDEAFFAMVEAPGFTPAATTDFEQACALMVYKVVTSYPGADVFLFNNPTMRTGNAANREKYNQVFAALAERYGCTLVDLYSSSISSYSTYTQDGIHPNTAGMDVMTDVFASALAERYVNQAETKPTITHNGKTVSFLEDVYFNIYAKVEGLDKEYVTENGGLLIWNADPGENAAFGTQDSIIEGLKHFTSNGGEYAVQTASIPAKAYADEMYVRHYVRLEDGSCIYDEVRMFSIQSYAESVLAGNYAMASKQMCAALLHYGAAAQVRFSYNLDDPANAGILDTWPADAWDGSLLTPAAAVNTALTGDADVRSNGQSITLGGATKLVYYFAPEANAGWTAQSARLQVWDNVSGQLTESNISYTLDMQYFTTYGGEWGAETRGILANQFEKTVFARAVITDTEGGLHYSAVAPRSIESYAEDCIKTNTNSKMVDAAKKLVVYGEYAKVRFP